MTEKKQEEKSKGTDLKTTALRFMKPKNILILAFVTIFAFTIQAYRAFFLRQFLSLGSVLPGHIVQDDIGRDIVSLKNFFLILLLHFITNLLFSV